MNSKNFAALHYDGITQPNDIDENVTSSEIIDVEKKPGKVIDDNIDEFYNRGYLYKDIPDFYRRVGILLNNSEIDPLIADYYEYAPSAEFEIKQKVPDWKDILKNYGLPENMEENTKKYNDFLICIIIQTAINMLPIVIGREYKTIQTVSAKIEYMDSGENGNLLNNLQSKLDELLSGINEKYGINKETFITLS